MSQNITPATRKLPRPALVVAAVAIVVGLAAGSAFMFLGDHPSNGNAAAAAGSTLKLDDIPFDGAAAYKYLKDLCAIGPRPSGSPGMAAQQKLLVEHFQRCGGQVDLQRFRARHPREDSWVSMANIRVRWNPEVADRILLCAHYDTLPLPLEDPENPQGTFIGANDNASGVAVLMQMARDMSKLKCKYGVDFVLLDGEEYVFAPRRDRFFLGSEYFAREYAKEQAAERPGYRYRWGVLLDMVGDADLEIRPDRDSLRWRDTQPLVKDIWGVAARLGIREFVYRPMHELDFLDDHIMLHDVGHIPCIDVIDFEYPPWHTQGDVPARCSPLSLAKVGWVMTEWLKTAK